MTTERATFALRQVPGIETFGGVALNLLACCRPSIRTAPARQHHAVLYQESERRLRHILNHPHLGSEPDLWASAVVSQWVTSRCGNDRRIPGTVAWRRFLQYVRLARAVAIRVRLGLQMPC